VGWMHDASHRLGVGYPNAALANRYAAASQASRIAAPRAANYRTVAPANNVAPAAVHSAPSQAVRPANAAPAAHAPASHPVSHGGGGHGGRR
jgi:hypothetical protein